MSATSTLNVFLCSEWCELAHEQHEVGHSTATSHPVVSHMSSFGPVVIEAEADLIGCRLGTVQVHVHLDTDEPIIREELVCTLTGGAAAADEWLAALA